MTKQNEIKGGFHNSFDRYLDYRNNENNPPLNWGDWWDEVGRAEETNVN